MNSAHFRNLDLNLLRVFVALLEEQSATRAGARLGLTQSAVSHALGRLRQALGDTLFVRSPSGLEATPRAAEMGASVRAALKLLETAVSTPSFDPLTDRRTFHIAASSYVCSVLMPGVVRRLLTEAPGVKLRMRALDSALAEDLDRGRLDMAIGGFDHVAPRFTHAPLFTETGVWVIRADHPAVRRGITPEVLATLPQLVISNAQTAEAGASALDGRELGLGRITGWSEDYALATSMKDGGAVVVPDSYSALAMVSQTDMVTLLPRRLATIAMQRNRLTLIEPTHHPEPASFQAVIRGGESQGGPVAWLLQLISEVAAEL